MSEHYGKVMRVMLGDQEWFILSGLEEIKQFSMKEESTFHLPSKTFNEMYSFDKPLGIIFPDGNLWREQRKFAMKTLKQLGLGRNSLEHHIEAETAEVCRFLADRVNSGQTDIRIDGVLDGDVITTGKVIIGKEAQVKGKLLCGNADIEGFFKGELTVSGILNLKNNSIVEGNVHIQKLIVESGAVFNAKSSMQNAQTNLSKTL